MKKLTLVLFAILYHSLSFAQKSENKFASKVNFNYAFATPHRITVSQPDSSDKTLIDLYSGKLRVSWTYENIIPFSSFSHRVPRTAWDFYIQPFINGDTVRESKWERIEGYLPAVINTYEQDGTQVTFQVIGGATAAIIKIEMKNLQAKASTVKITWQRNPSLWSGFYNPAWIDTTQVADNLQAGFGVPADQLLALGVGADKFTLARVGNLEMNWRLEAGEGKTAWLLRPYHAFDKDLPSLRKMNWQGEFDEAKNRWKQLLQKSCKFTIPDVQVSNALYASLADCFIMREPIANGNLIVVPGTENYRSINSVEPAIASIVMDQMGMHDEAERGFRENLDRQELNGDWTEPAGWSHHMWLTSGFKAWNLMEHFMLTNDTNYLKKRFPQLLACSRWQEKLRSSTRVLMNGQHSSTFGLMPRGMGDAGLIDEDDRFGVFYAHNIWSLFADSLSLKAAEILGMAKEAKELKEIYGKGKEDLLASLQKGVITENDGIKWIPAVSGKTIGSRFGALNILFPAHILPPYHEFITGTLKFLEGHQSPGGIPLHTGFLIDGMWVAMALDNLAEAHLARNEGDAAVKLLYATLNHGTPLFTWCEERGKEANSTTKIGDLQHLWTPVAVVRCIRDAFVMEEGDNLFLGRGIDRDWVGSGEKIGVKDAPSHFGKISYEYYYDAKKNALTGYIDFPESSRPYSVVFECRTPSGKKIKKINVSSGAKISGDGYSVHWSSPKGKQVFTIGF